MGNVCWKPPKILFARINFDVAYNKNDNSSCSGLVVKNSNGRVSGSRSILNEYVPSVFATEALA